MLTIIAHGEKPLEYLKTIIMQGIFMWFTIPYNGWKMINGDKVIVVDHWEMKVINNKC